MTNSKIDRGLIPVLRTDSNGILRTVYIREEDFKNAERFSVEKPFSGALSSRSVLNKREQRHERTESEEINSLGIGSSVEEADKNMHEAIEEVEDDPDLMRKPGVRERMVGFLAYARQRAATKRRLMKANKEDRKEKAPGARVRAAAKNPMLRIISDEDDDPDTAVIETQTSVNTDALRDEHPDIYDESDCDGTVEVETKVLPAVEDGIDRAVEQSERKRTLTPEQRAQVSQSANNDAQRVEKTISDYATDGAGDLDGKKVKDAERDIEDNIERKSKRRPFKRRGPRPERGPIMQDSSGQVGLFIKPNAKMTIYELHARLDEMIHRGDGSDSAQLDRQAQNAMYSRLVNVKATDSQRRAQKAYEREEQREWKHENKEALREEKAQRKREKKQRNDAKRVIKQQRTEEKKQQREEDKPQRAREREEKRAYADRRRQLREQDKEHKRALRERERVQRDAREQQQREVAEHQHQRAQREREHSDTSKEHVLNSDERLLFEGHEYDLDGDDSHLWVDPQYDPRKPAEHTSRGNERRRFDGDDSHMWVDDDGQMWVDPDYDHPWKSD